MSYKFINVMLVIIALFLVILLYRSFQCGCAATATAPIVTSTSGDTVNPVGGDTVTATGGDTVAVTGGDTVTVTGGDTVTVTGGDTVGGTGRAGGAMAGRGMVIVSRGAHRDTTMMKPGNRIRTVILRRRSR